MSFKQFLRDRGRFMGVDIKQKPTLPSDHEHLNKSVQSSNKPSNYTILNPLSNKSRNFSPLPFQTFEAFQKRTLIETT